MAARLGPIARRRRTDVPQNVRVELEGRTYRVCHQHGRVLMVMLKCSAGGERALEPKGRRGRQVIREAGL